MARAQKIGSWLASDREPELTAAGLRVLDAASELFYARGIRAVGVDLVAERAGTTKKTLYDVFGSKDALVAVYLHRRSLRWRRFVLDWLEARASEPGEARVLAVFDALEDWHRGSSRGCAFVNAHAEIDAETHPATAVIRADKEWMADLFVSLCGEADVVRADESARALHLLFEGALVLRTVGDRPVAIADAREVAARLLGAAG